MPRHAHQCRLIRDAGCAESVSTGEAVFSIAQDCNDFSIDEVADIVRLREIFDELTEMRVRISVHEECATPVWVVGASAFGVWVVGASAFGVWVVGASAFSEWIVGASAFGVLRQKQ